MSHTHHNKNGDNHSHTIPRRKILPEKPRQLCYVEDLHTYIHTYINSGSSNVQEKHMSPKVDDDDDVPTREKDGKPRTLVLANPIVVGSLGNLLSTQQESPNERTT